MSNPVKKVSKTFEQIMADFNADPLTRNAPEFAKALNAGAVDVGNRYVDAQRDDSYPDSAITRPAQLLNLAGLDYYPSGYTTSSGIQRFNIDPNASFPKTILLSDLRAIRPRDGLQYEARSGEVFSPTTYAMTFNFANQSITVSSVFDTGDLFRFSIVSGSLPTGVDATTNYYVIYISDIEIKIANSLKNAKNGVYVSFLNDFTGTQQLVSYALKVTAYQQKSVSKTFLDNPTTDPFQEIKIPDSKVLRDQVIVYHDTVNVSIVEHLVDLAAGALGCRPIFLNDESLYLRFGDDTRMGFIPTLPIYAEWATGGGLQSKEGVVGAISVYAGTDSEIIDTWNTTEFSGGADIEDYEVSKVLARELLSAGNRFDFVTHGEALAKAYANLSIVKVHKNTYGPLSCQVVIVPYGGGSTTAAFKLSIQDYLISKTTLEQMDVRVFDHTPVTVSLTSDVRKISGADSAIILSHYNLGAKLLLSERLGEIIDDYEANGVTSVRALINSIFTLSLSSSDEEQIVKFLDNFTPIKIGGSIDKSDVEAFLRVYTIDVDDVQITSPAFPINLSSTEMTTPGTMTTNVT